MLAKFQQYRLIGLIMMMAVGLRLLKLTFLARPMWYDETFTAWLAQLSPAGLIAATAGDVHPPLYYLVEWVAARILGSSPWALRLPSAVFGLLAVWLAYRLFVLLALPAPVINLATLSVAVLPVQLHYSHDARMYALLLALSIWAAIEVKQNHFGRFAIIGLLMMYTHNAAVFTLAGLGLWWLVDTYPNWGKYLRQWLLVLALIGLGYAPWAIMVVPEQARTNWWLQSLTPAMIVQTFDFLYWFEGFRGFYSVHAGVLTLGLLVAGWMLLIRDGRAGLIVPPLGAILANVLVSLLVVPVFLNRLFIGLTPWLYLASAWALWRTWQSLPRPVLYAGMLPVLVLGLVGYQVQSVNTDRSAELLAAVELREGDVCYHFNVPSLVFFRYYLPQCDHWLWPGQVTSLLSPQAQKAMGMQQAGLSALPREWKRAWLFLNNDPFAGTAAQNTIQREAAGKMLRQFPAATAIMRTKHKATTSHFIENELWLVQR